MVTVVEAVERDIAAVALRDPALAESALAATAMALAREIDAEGNSATSKSMCARALNETLATIRELAPDEAAADGLDQLAARRARRRKAS